MKHLSIRYLDHYGQTIHLFSAKFLDHFAPFNEVGDVIQSIFINGHCGSQFSDNRVTLTSPMELYTDATATIIDPMRKSARSIVTMGPMESLSISRFSGPLSLSQSVLIVVPYIISLVAITIVCFAVSYTVFMRQEIRSL